MQHSDTHNVTLTEESLRAAVQDQPSKAIENSKSAPQSKSTRASVIVVIAVCPTNDALLAPLASLSPPPSESPQLNLAHGIVPGLIRTSSSSSFSVDISSFGMKSASITTARPSLPDTCPLQRRSTYPRPSPPGFLYPAPIVPCYIDTCTLGAATTTTAIPSQPRVDTLPRRSKYPRPSPPGFLYPEPIVPRSVYENTMQDGSVGNGNVLWYLPYGLEVLIFAVLLLGFAWATLIMLINFTPRTWRSFACDGGAATKKTAKSKQSSTPDHGVKDRRPLDRPSKYAPPEPIATTFSTQTSTPFMYIHENLHLVELPQRRDNTYTSHRRAASSPGNIRFKSPSFILSSPIIPSPPNLYLAPPHSPISLRHRTSTEWHTERATFFSPSPPHSSASSITDPDEYAAMDNADIEALEAGTPRSGKKAEAKKGSWVDLNLGQVEDAVSGLVGRVARWTDDVGGGEGVVLPVSNGARGRGRSVEVE